MTMTSGSRMTIFLALLLSLATGCMTSSYETWEQSQPMTNWVRPGRVESVREVVQRREGNPAGGAVVGALIGGFLFGGRGPGALIGAAGGAAVGAAASQSSETHTFQVLVHFDDGAYGMFVYANYPYFQVGQPVLLTQQGLVAASR
jgi:outer membrane lipoprotein SlyB